MFRVFGCPYTPALHQHVTYLRLRRLPFKVYCSTFTTTLFYSVYYRARNSVCTLGPDGQSHLQFWQVMQACEAAQAKPLRVDRASVAASDNRAAFEGSGDGSVGTPLVVNRTTHPQLHLVSWLVTLYASWWLTRVGAMFRWVHSTSDHVIQGYLNYFLMLGTLGISKPVSGKFRVAMQRMLIPMGISSETERYLVEHFERLCDTLEFHFSAHPDERHFLCTPNPTIADVAIGAVFSGYFLMDDPPATAIAERWPQLFAYLERTTGMKDGQFGALDAESASGAAADDAANDASKSAGAAAAAAANFPDTVPDTLSPFLDLVIEVMPFIMSQCAAFNAYVTGDGIRHLRKCTLEAPWSGCEAYLLQQMTDIKSLMIIDNGVYTLHARAQDLELALLVAREVSEGAVEARAAQSSDDGTQAMIEGEQPRTADAQDGRTTESDGMTIRSEEADVKAAVTAPGDAEEDIAARMDVLMDTADFHRVFTKKGKRPKMGSPLPVLSRKNAADLMRDASPLDKQLVHLRATLMAMHNPHYTLSSVFHGRRLFVAVIPEYEVNKWRESTKQSESF